MSGPRFRVQTFSLPSDPRERVDQPTNGVELAAAYAMAILDDVSPAELIHFEWERRARTWLGTAFLFDGSRKADSTFRRGPFRDGFTVLPWSRSAFEWTIGRCSPTQEEEIVDAEGLLLGPGRVVHLPVVLGGRRCVVLAGHDGDPVYRIESLDATEPQR